MPGRSSGVSRRRTPGLSSCQLPVAVAPCRTCPEARWQAVRLRQHADRATIASPHSRMVRMTLLLCGSCDGKEGARLRDAEVVVFSALLTASAQQHARLIADPAFRCAADWRACC